MNVLNSAEYTLSSWFFLVAPTTKLSGDFLLSLHCRAVVIPPIKIFTSPIFTMKKIVIALLLSPIICLAQKPVPCLEGDTLFTTSGFKMYKGQTLQLTKGTAKGGNFRFIRSAWNAEGITLTGSLITIKQFKKLVITPLGNGYIYVKVKVVYHDGSKGGGELKINFDKAIQPFADLPGEIVVPDEFKVKTATGTVEEEMAKLNKLYQDSIITKEEFEAQKKKLLNH